MGVGRPTMGITSPVKVTANIFVSFIGAGMLGLPYAYREVPLIPPDSSDDEDDDERHPPTPSTDLTYGDVGLYALGPGGKRLVDIAIVVSQIGFCCGYLIYLCKNLNIYIPRFSQRLWLMLLLPPLYCLTLLRHLNKLAIFSLFAQVSNVLALTVVFWFDFSHSEEVPFTPKEFSIKGFPFFFAVAIYCYEGAGMILSLEESMAEHKRDKFRSIFVCTMSGLTMLYICFGVSGYASFGPHTKDIITLNLPHGTGVVNFAAMVKICLGVSLFFTYPMMMFPVTHLMDKTLGIVNISYRGNILRLILVVLTGLVVSAVPNFAILMSLVGATCCTLLAFILPAAFHLSIFKQRLSRRQRYFDILLITLGAIGSVVGLCDAFNRMNQGHDSLIDVNEFSSVKNGSLHNVHTPFFVAPDSKLDNMSTSVLSTMSTAQEKFGKFNKTKNFNKENMQSKTQSFESKVVSDNTDKGAEAKESVTTATPAHINTSGNSSVTSTGPPGKTSQNGVSKVPHNESQKGTSIDVKQSGTPAQKPAGDTPTLRLPVARTSQQPIAEDTKT
ncbi:amino acid transporter AVT3B-like isoform X2 [Homarus americanus]|uniref:amino acid transporter AVT3B-like isoform X2 n=1 Tax=Homarus americanus TaxID=6706 RepID=UPI001C48B05D|nr:amino acid transporter AVT3B-like isoform X2 [Homarus americanus]